jgi:acyl-CoA reductase-like NAD-dependent aldehyde dehydrogenase
VDTCDMVFFTGSVASGKAVARRAAERLIPCVTELGGKSAFIVLEDADLDAAATAAVWGCFANAGQICIRPERILVLESVADDFLARVLAKTRALHDQQGSVASDIGPVMTDEQVGRARAQLMDALAQGASIRCGIDPQAMSLGRRLPPTVVDHVSPACRLSREETFAPILAVTRVRDTESALSLANDSDLGLAGYVFTRDVARGRQVARALRVGSVCVNDVLVNYLCVNAPLGGFQQSGIGFRNGAAALLQFCHAQSLVEDRPFLEWVSPWVRQELAFPYKRRTNRLIRWLMSVLYR